MRIIVGVASALFTLCGCVTEAQHIHQTTLPDGKVGYVVTCNSQRYDRCLNRATRACGGVYTIVPQGPNAVRFADQVPGIGNSEAVVVSCGK